MPDAAEMMEDVADWGDEPEEIEAGLHAQVHDARRVRLGAEAVQLFEDLRGAGHCYDPSIVCAVGVGGEAACFDVFGNILDTLGREM